MKGYKFFKFETNCIKEDMVNLFTEIANNHGIKCYKIK